MTKHTPKVYVIQGKENKQKIWTQCASLVVNLCFKPNLVLDILILKAAIDENTIILDLSFKLKKQLWTKLSGVKNYTILVYDLQ